MTGLSLNPGMVSSRYGVTRRYQHGSTIITTNKPFAEWNQVFPNAASVVTIIDRLVHKAEIITIEGDSYCLGITPRAAFCDGFPRFPSHGRSTAR